MIIGSVDFGAVIDALHPAQQRLAREINPKVFSAHEWKMKLTVPDPFVSDVSSNKKIFLIGDEYGLADLASGSISCVSNAISPNTPAI